MPIFTADITGRPTVAFAARDYAAALAFVNDDFIRAELCNLLTTDGEALWNRNADVTVRPANAAERAVWERSMAGDLAEGVHESREDAIEGGCFAFLVPYKEPTEP